MINYLKKIRMPVSFAFGYMFGFMFGDRNIFIKYGEKPKTLVLRHSIQFISGFTFTFLSLTYPIFIPIIMIDYYGDLCIIDKIIDIINSKYLFEYKREHQYDKNDNKYYAPSHLHITIKKKESLLEDKIKDP
uniref:Uncharacterized protein n=1 Tax=viral metagenome TaxID=1070528 RepID=A0A6C0AGS4_9ZZZZ